MEKTLIFSDIHLHPWRAFGLNLQSGLPKRLEEQKQVLEQILDLVKKEKIKVVVFGGDLFHKIGEIPVECLNIADWFFNKLREQEVDYWLAVGNHDVIDRSNPQWFENASRIWSRSRGVSSAPFFIGNYFDSNEEIEKARGYELVVIHKTPMYAKINEYIFEEGVRWEELAKNNRFVFFGHLHQPQKLAENCFVIGSCMQLGFGESGDRGVWIVDGKPEFYPLKSPKFITVRTYSEVQDDGNYYRVLEADRIDKDMDNVIAVYTPKVIEERIKADSFNDVLNEWLNVKGKDKSYVEVIKDVIHLQPKKIVKSFVGKLKRVRIKNFLSIGDIEYEVPKGFTLIAGENGSGKTTLVEAIFYGLFGKTTKGLTGDDVVREGQDDCLIELELQNEKEKIKIVRQRQVLKVYANDKEIWPGVRLIDKQKLLEEEMLGFDYRMFLTSCYFSQESLLMFTSLTDSGRTELVSNLLGFDIYDSLYEKVSDKIKAYDVSIKDAETYKGTLKEKFAYTEASLKKIDESIKQIDDFIAYKNNQINEKIESVEKLKAIGTIKIEVRDYHKDFEELNRLKEELKKRIDEVENDIEKNLKIYLEVQSAEQDKARDFAIIQKEMKELEKKYNEVDTLKEGTRCDRCGSIVSLENLKLLKENIMKEFEAKAEISDTIYKELSKIDEELKKIDTQINELKTKKQSLNERFTKIDLDIKNLINEQREYEKQIEEARKIGTVIQENLMIIEEYKKDLETLEKRKAETLKEKENIVKDYNELKTALEDVDKTIQKFKESSEKLEFWKESFSNKGIKSLLLDKFCNQFNLLVNSILADVSMGSMSIIISPTLQLKSGEERNKIGLEIRIKNAIRRYESLSGGEKRRIDIALCIALNRWVKSFLGVLIIDELFAYMDRAGEEAIGGCLFREGQNKAVLVISHTPELGSYADRIWTMAKENGVSRLIK